MVLALMTLAVINIMVSDCRVQKNTAGITAVGYRLQVFLETSYVNLHEGTQFNHL